MLGLDWTDQYRLPTVFVVSQVIVAVSSEEPTPP